MDRSRNALAEQLVLLVLAAAATVRAERGILFHPHSYQPDAMIHEYWMRRFQDSHLFTDPLTRALIHAGYVPFGVQGIYWIASQMIDPVRFGAWAAVILAPVSALLVFKIVRELTDWKPAAWIGAALFLAPVDIERFSGTHARAFLEPIVLLTLLLALRRRWRAAATVPAVGACLYPPASLIALGVLASSALGWRDRRPAVDRTVAIWTAGSAAVALVAVLAPRVTGLQSSHLISASVARHYADFGPHGHFRFFGMPLLALLRGKYSGLHLRSSGSILAVGAATVLLLRPANVRLLRREVIAMGLVSLALFVIAYLVLFRLYLPNRYAQPLIAFSCIVIAVCWQPIWSAIGRRVWVWLLPAVAVVLPAAIVWISVRFFQLGLQLSPTRFRALIVGGKPTLGAAMLVGVGACAATIATRRRSADLRTSIVVSCALLSASLLAGSVAVAAGNKSLTYACRPQSLMAELRTLPNVAIIAGDPLEMDCVPIDTDRPVVISRKIYQPFDTSLFQLIRSRMFTMLKAYYGDSRRAIVDLRSKYGADYLVVDRNRLEHPPGTYNQMQPFGRYIHRLLRSQPTEAAMSLPPACAVWHHGSGLLVYDLKCVSDSGWADSGRTGA